MDVPRNLEKIFWVSQEFLRNGHLNLVKTALESGIMFFDTGFNYGYAEERLGRCLSTIFGEGTLKREDIVVQTKGCETLNTDGSYGSNDYSPDWIKKSVEISLKRLQLDYIDLYALHSANPEVLSDDLFYLFEDLKSQGIIRAYGVCGISNDFGYWISEQKCFDYVMMTYNYTEARRNPLIEKLHENGIGILSGGSLNRSMNTIKYFSTNRNELWYLLRVIAHYKRELYRSKKFEFIKDVVGMSPQQVSLAYVLKNIYVTAASFNTINLDHLKDNVLAVDMKVPQEILKRLEETE